MSVRQRSRNTRGAARGRGASRAVAPQSRRWRPGWLKPLLVLVLLGEAVYAGTLGVQFLYERVNERTIEFIKIEGELAFVREQDVQRALARFMDESLVSIRLGEVKQVLEGHPWIRSVSLRREWPDTMTVNVKEHVPIARWGGQQLLNQQGEIFQPEAGLKQAYLPTLTGPQGTQQRVMQQYQKFNQLLYPLGLRIAALDLNSRGAWQVSLENGVSVKVGNKHVMEKMRRLVTFMDSSFMDQLAGIETIDLRYSNGISVSKRNLLGDL